MLPPHKGEIPQLYQRALDLYKTGDLDGAQAILQRLLLVQPKAAPLWYQMGRIETDRGAFGAAEEALRKALALGPKERAIWQALHRVVSGAAAKKLEREALRAKVPLGSEAELRPVLALISKGSYERAETQALAHVKQAPDAFWPAFALGRARAAQEKWTMAYGPLSVALARDPDHPDAQFALGQCQALLRHPLAAEALLAPLADRQFAARVELAQVYADTLRYEEAAVLLRDGAPSKAAPKGTYETLAEIEARLGAVDAALRAAGWARARGEAPRRLFGRLAAAFQEAGASSGADRALAEGLVHAPKDPGLRTQRAQRLQSDGRMDEAETELRAVIEERPDWAEAYRAYTAGQKIQDGDAVMSKAMSQLARPDLPAASRRVLHFAVAKGIADLKAFDKVFEHLNKANRLMAEAFPYNFEDDLSEARRLVADWDMLQGLDAKGPGDPVLFVTGLPRSGTTLVETILAAHPNVEAGGEMPFLNKALTPAMELLREGTPDRRRFAEAGTRYLEAARRRTGSLQFTDKAISTFSRIGHAARCLPGARFLVLKRDHRDTGLSMYRNMFPEGQHRYTTDLAAMGHYMRLHDSLVAFWQAALPDRVHIVDYEALTADPEPHIRALVAFAGLDWDDGCLAPERNVRRVDTLSFAQVRAPIGRQAVQGWRRYEADLAPLISALDEPMIDLAKPAANQLGAAEAQKK